MKLLFNTTISVFWLTAFITIFPSCNNEMSGPTTIIGTVKDVTTNTPVTNAQVGLFETDGESAFGLGGTLLEEKYSDGSGKFTFNFNARDNYEYYVQAIKEQYFNNQTDNVTFVFEQNNESVEVFLQPEAYLKLHCKNASPFNDDDDLTISTTLNGSYPEFLGTEVDTNICCFIIYGNINNSIGYWVSKNDTSIHYYLDVYSVAFDTVDYEILY